MTKADAGTQATIFAGNTTDSNARKTSGNTLLERTAMKFMRKTAVALALGAVSLLAPMAAHAQAPVTDDTYSQRGREWTNGSAPLVVVQSPNVNGYLRFNLSVFPPMLLGSDIQQATLKLFVNSVQGAGTMYVCRLEANQQWMKRSWRAPSRVAIRARTRYPC